MSEIHSTLFFVCITYGICGAPWMFLCTSWVIHVVPMVFCLLAYCGLLTLSLVGILVCSCSQILQIFMCKLIGGNQLLVSVVDSDLSLLEVVICPIEQGEIQGQREQGQF